MLFSCVRSLVLFTYKWLCLYYKQSEMFLSNIFRHTVHTLMFKSGFRVLCSVFVTAINYIKMTEKKQNVLLYMMSPKVVGFFGWCCSCWSPTQISCWAQMESVGDDRWCQVSNSKPQSLSCMNQRWTQYGWKWPKMQNGKKTNPGLSNSTSLLMV